jgi:hypothetical protein
LFYFKELEMSEKAFDQIREFTLSDEMLFPDAKSLTGLIERQSEAGFTLKAKKSGKIVKYSATGPDGTELEGKYLKMIDGAPIVTPLETCFYCVKYGGAWFCTEVLCPEQ